MSEFKQLKPYWPKKNVEYLGTASRAASFRPEPDYRERVEKQNYTPQQLDILAKRVGLYIKRLPNVREHRPQYRICEDWPAVSEKNARGCWTIVERARTVRYHKEAWLTANATWELLKDIEHQMFPPKEHHHDDTWSQTKI